MLRLKHLLTAIVLTACSVPVSASVEISAISVTVPYFSPDGDGTQDLTGIRFDVESDHDTVYVWVTVRDDLDNPVRTIAEAEAREPGTVNKIWDGRNSAGQYSADGTYTFEIVAMAGSDSDDDRSATVVLDTAPPAFTTLIYPNPYTPGLPFADDSLTIDVTVTAAQPDDWLMAWIANDEPPETLCTYQLDRSDTTHTCFWDGRNKSDDLYNLFVRVWDRAGNSDEASYTVDLDIEGPWATFTRPQQAYMVGFPDSVKGKAFDRSGIDSIGLRFYGNTEYMPVNETFTGSDTLAWYVVWPESLKIEAQFSLQIYTSDRLGHESTKSFSLTIDMTAPAVPTFDALPQRVSEPDLAVSGTSTSDDSVMIYLNGQIAARVRCSPTGVFKATLQLELGANSIYGVAKDKTGNQSSPSATEIVSYTEDIGVLVPELLEPGSEIELNLARSADRITLRIFSSDGYYIDTVVLEEPDLYNEFEWDLNDSDGNPVRNGPYVLVLSIEYVDGTVSTDKMIVVVSR